MESGASERVYVPAHDVLVSDIDDTKVPVSYTHLTLPTKA